jgi:hypothetical protein
VRAAAGGQGCFLLSPGGVYCFVCEGLKVLGYTYFMVLKLGWLKPVGGAVG